VKGPLGLTASAAVPEPDCTVQGSGTTGPRRFRARASALAVVFVAVSAGALLNASASGKPSITVTPNKDLSNPIGDPQFVRINWSGIPFGTLVYVRQCSAHPTSATKDCSQPGLFGPGLVTAGASGANKAGTVVFPVYEGDINGPPAGQTGGAKGFPCDYKNDCTVAVFTDDLASNLRSAITAPIQFAFPTSACPAASGPSIQGSGAAGAFWPMIAWEGAACRPPHNLSVRYTLKNSYYGMTA
jgi:hypothetical protein